MAQYLFHGPDGQKRVYHHTDVNHTGPSVSLLEFAQGQNPPVPRVETYAPPETMRLVVERQQGQPLPPGPVPRPHVNLLACTGCGRVTGCRCGVPKAPDLDSIVAMKRQRGQMP